MSTASSIPPDQLAELHRLATTVAGHAYAPYSKFRVGAALLLQPDRAAGIHSPAIVTGCNVENVSYRLTTCAEQAAIAAAVALFGPKLRLRAVVIANLNHAACAPCGACRQTILEFATPATRVFFPGAGNETIEASISDLVPNAFLAESLS